MSIGSGTTKEIGKGNTRRHNHILPPLIFIVKQEGGGRQEDMNKVITNLQNFLPNYKLSSMFQQFRK